MRNYGFREISFRKLRGGMHNPAATADKGRVPLSIEVSRAGSTPLAGSAYAGEWILWRAESFSG